MRNFLISAYLIITMLALLELGNSAKAQKAYDLIIYKAMIYGNPTTLQLADGYLLASKVTIRSKYGDQVFTTADDAPGKQRDLKFNRARSNGAYQKSAGSWLILKALNVPEFPLRIKAVYWDGKMRKTIVFENNNRELEN